MTLAELVTKYSKPDFDGVVTHAEYVEIEQCLEANKPEDQPFLWVGPNGRLLLFGVELCPQ